MGSTEEHQRLLHECMLAVSKHFHNARMFKRIVGNFLLPKTHERISVNKKGMPDAYIIFFLQYPIHIEVEIKTGNAVLSKNQKLFKKFIEDNEGIYIVCRSVEQLIEALKEIKERVKSNILPQ